MTIEGVEVTRWRAGKARNMMRYLVTRRDVIVPRETLNEILWPGEAKPVDHCSLKVAAHALRKTLSDEVFVDSRVAARLDFEDFGYILRIPGAWVDVDVFQLHAKAGFAAEVQGNREQAIHEYRAAAALFRGDFLPGEDAQWAVEQQMWLRAKALRVFHRLASLELQSGDEFSAIDWCHRAAELDPYNENTYQILMLLHANSGELGMALAWYSVCEGRLLEDLGVPVSDATQQVLAAIVKGRQTAKNPHPHLQAKLAAPPLLQRRGLNPRASTPGAGKVLVDGRVA